MAVDKDQVKELLGSGLSNELVASAVGCDPSYVSQLLADEIFAQEVATLRAANLMATNKRDRSIDGIEDKLIVQLGELVEQRMIYKPGDVLRAFKVLNDAKRRGSGAQENMVVNQQVVNLTIPMQVVKNFTLSQQGEVVEVEGQTMVTMPTSQLLKTLTTENKNAGEKYQRVAALLPSAFEHGVGEPRK